MKVTKRVIANLDMVYAVSPIRIHGQLHLLAATESQGKCLVFSPPDWKPSTVWDGPGGAMSLVPLPDGDGAFLAIQEFFPVFQSENAGIVYTEPGVRPASWSVRRVLDLPFVHRIEAVSTPHGIYLIAASLCGGKSFVDDWSKPGAVYAATIPDDRSDRWVLEPVLTGVGKNHGMHATELQGKPTVLIAGQQGLFSLEVPQERGCPFRSEQLLDHEISDMVAFDIDGDGQKEIVTIEPFHGDRLCIYKCMEAVWRPVMEQPISFGHAVWAGVLRNQPAVIFGNRSGQKELAILDPSTGDRLVIDQGVGPAQVAVVHEPARDLILSANHAVGEVALYEIAGNVPET
jgi:hypothetical protein